MLVLNFNSICMDESWGDPENFRPERFLDENGNVFMPKNYFPFSMGESLPPSLRCYFSVLICSPVYAVYPSHSLHRTNFVCMLLYTEEFVYMDRVRTIVVATLTRR